MNIKEVKDLIQEVLQSDISEFELEHTGTRVRLKRRLGPNSTLISPASSQSLSGRYVPAKSNANEAVITSAENSEASEEDAIHVITSPIVGTVYRSPSPDAEPYVKVGDPVEEGSILCLVEAMKLMNEIPSDMDGEIVRIYIENRHSVEYGQKLFGIRPRKQG
jgi:acetyl-CoA carboxylase biotin carboxyl carrier protein